MAVTDQAGFSRSTGALGDDLPFNIRMKRMLCLTILSLAVTVTAGDKRYDFRASEAYAQLSATEKQRLEQVRRDQALLWGALDMYCDDHDDTPPATLDALVPRYLAE